MFKSIYFLITTKIDTYNSPQGDGNQSLAYHELVRFWRSIPTIPRKGTETACQAGSMFLEKEDRYLQFPARGRKH